MLRGGLTAAPLLHFDNDIINDMSDMVAVFAENGLFDSSIGRLQKGYNIIADDKAEAWMNITNKVRLATAQEVAQAYGV